MPSVGPLEILVVFAIGAFWVAVIGLLIYGLVGSSGARATCRVVERIASVTDARTIVSFPDT